MLGSTDEAGVWITCGIPQVWKAFWESMKVLMFLRKDEKKWAEIFRGKLGRLLPDEQRFACPQYPHNVIWVSGDATLHTIAGVSWFDKEYFVTDAPPLVRELKRDLSEEIIIGECELLVTIIGSLLWGMRNGHPRIIIRCTDNYNVFAWLTKWKAKIGTSSRLLRSLIDYLIEHGIEIIPRFVRSGHNFSCDHLSRTDEYGIGKWAKTMNMKPMGLPNAWYTLVDSWRPEVDFLNLERADIPRTLRSWGKVFVGCEWRPSGYSFASAVETIGGICYVDDPAHPVARGKIGVCTQWDGQLIDVLCGMAWSDFEMEDFPNAIKRINPGYAILITPFAMRQPELVDGSWTETITVDSSRFASALNQRWRLYLWGNLKEDWPTLYMDHLCLDTSQSELCMLADAYRKAGFNAMQDDLGMLRTTPFDNLSGVTVIAETQQGQRYSCSSHMPQITMSEIWTDSPRWPQNADTGEEISLKDKIVVLGGHPDWRKMREVTEKVLANVLYLSGPASLWNHCIYGVLTAKGIDGFLEEESVIIPDLNNSRAGGTIESGIVKTADYLNSIVTPTNEADGNRAPDDVSGTRNFFKNQYEYVFGVGKLEDLLSGVSEGTKGTYISAWQQWFQFNSSTPEKRWINEMTPKWDEQIINWILFETRVLGLKAGTMRGKISAVRYWHLLAGLPDFSKWCGRCKQILKSIEKESTAQRNYPFNLELILYAKNEIIGRREVDQPAEREEGLELYASMTTGFFYLLRVSELEGLRMKDVRIEKEDGVTFLNLHIKGSKTDQYNAGDQKRLGEVGGRTVPH